MAKYYQVTPLLRFANGILVQLLRWGMLPPSMALLTVRGRKSGRTYSIPVQPIDEGGQVWVVSPYGETNWVRNVRAAGKATLTRAGCAAPVGLHEVDAQAAAPILKKYVHQVAIVRPYFDAQPNSPAATFESEARQHPVFLVEP
jgi:deazaflavin-dependent oxidoreductase (nitroreductase family)